jgi:hypothetical protein
LDVCEKETQYVCLAFRINLLLEDILLSQCIVCVCVCVCACVCVCERERARARVCVCVIIR